MITNISPSQTKISYGLITEITACDNLAKINSWLGEMGYEQAYERHNPVCCPVFVMCYVDTCTQQYIPRELQVNTLRPRQNGRHFADDTFKRIFLKENVRISIKISLKFVHESPIDNIPALFQIMAWRRPGAKPLSEAMMASLLTHICVARPQWDNVIDLLWPSGTIWRCSSWSTLLLTPGRLMKTAAVVFISLPGVTSGADVDGWMVSQTNTYIRHMYVNELWKGNSIILEFWNNFKIQWQPFYLGVIDIAIPRLLHTQVTAARLVKYHP